MCLYFSFSAEERVKLLLRWPTKATMHQNQIPLIMATLMSNPTYNGNSNSNVAAGDQLVPSQTESSLSISYYPAQYLAGF